MAETVFTKTIKEIDTKLDYLRRVGEDATGRYERASKAGMDFAAVVYAFLSDPDAIGTLAVREAYDHFMSLHAGSFHASTVVDIIVNGVKHPMALTDGCVSYEQVVNLANQPHGATVAYSHGADDTHGSLIAGRWARVQDGTIFDAVVTSNA